MRKSIIHIVLFISSTSLFAQHMQIDTSLSVEQLVKEILMSAEEFIRVENVKYTGSPKGIGYFISSNDIIPVNRGVVLCTGNVHNCKGPNLDAGKSSSNKTYGDKDLNTIANGETFDAAVLEFDFISRADSFCFDYFFGSEEYPEYVNDNVDDVFAFYIYEGDSTLKRNIALLSGNNEVVSIDNVNNEKNNEYYISNKLLMDKYHFYYKSNPEAYDLSVLFQFDGFTSLLKAGSKIVPGKRYHLKIVIADVGDDMFDSGVFLGAGSFRVAGIIKKGQNVKEKLEYALQQEEIITINENEDSLSVIVKVKFAFDSYDIPSSYHSFLDTLANILYQNSGYNLDVIGHTDDIGNDNYNLTLSEKRAQTITDYLCRKGIVKNRITTIGVGNSQPLSEDKSEEARAKNRRVEFILHKY